MQEPSHVELKANTTSSEAKDTAFGEDYKLGKNLRDLLTALSFASRPVRIETKAAGRDTKRAIGHELQGKTSRGFAPKRGYFHRSGCCGADLFVLWN